MYYIFFAIVFACFGYHTAVHLLEHFRKIKENRYTHLSIGITMFFAWFSYFYISFSGTDPLPIDIGYLRYAGLIMLIIGFYLFFVSHAKVHKRMHDGKGGLVTDGIYRYIRHPMYVGESLLLLGAPILGQAKMAFMLSFIFIAQILLWRYFEEKELSKEFPEYAEYKKRTWF